MQVHVLTVPSPRFVLQGSMLSREVDLGNVPWSTHFALLLDGGEQRTGGHEIAALAMDVDPSQGRVRLQVRLTRPGPGAFVVQMITRPHAIVLVPRAGLSGRVQIELVDEQGNPLDSAMAALE